jgi:outer membrane lipoprotein-sorting protein
MRLLCDIFRGLIKVEERFEVKMLDRNQKGENQIGLTPNPPWESIDRIIITVSDDNKIRLVGINYQLGGVTMFTLNDVSAKKDFEEDYFSFSVPEGVTLIEENK